MKILHLIYFVPPTQGGNLLFVEDNHRKSAAVAARGTGSVLFYNLLCCGSSIGRAAAL